MADTVLFVSIKHACLAPLKALEHVTESHGRVQGPQVHIYLTVCILKFTSPIYTCKGFEYTTLTPALSTNKEATVTC